MLKLPKIVSARSKSGAAASREPRVLIARPRLDCSFKVGTVPRSRGEPLNSVLHLFGRLIDDLTQAHVRLGHHVDVDERPLWQFELEALQQQAAGYDRVYFPHRQARQFPIGHNAFLLQKRRFPRVADGRPEWLGCVDVLVANHA